MQLNQEQLEFVEHSESNMLVSASAGSGKTTTMIAKLIDLIVNKNIPVKNLLVVTFTEASASDMKQKLYFGLMEEIKNKQLNTDVLENLYKQIEDVLVADIGTLHSVCKKIVTKYFYEINVEPNFKILGEEEYFSLFNTALDNVINKYTEKEDDEFFTIYSSFNDKRNTTKLKELLSTIYAFLSEKSNEQSWINNVVLKSTEPNLNTNICAKFLFDYYSISIINSYKTLSAMLNECEHTELKLLVYVKEVLSIIYPLTTAKNFKEFNLEINKELKFPTLRDPKNIDAIDLFEGLKLAMKSLKSLVEKAKENFVTSNLEALEKTNLELNKIYKKLFEIINNLQLEFTKQKANIGCVDFSDLQKYTLKILDNEIIKSELQNNYKYIFVDEYQDINQIQEDIILKLSNGKNLFMIGDVKQSIYAFRQCKPEIFLSKYKLYNSIHSMNKLLKLNENYRSSKAVINFANYVFDAIIRKDTIGIDYKKDARLVCKSEALGEVNISIINTDELDEDSDKSDLEAQIVVKQIGELLGKTYYNDKLKCEQKIDYKDIAILVRDAKDFVFKLYNTLVNYKIPVTCSFKQGISNSIEIKLLISLLQILNNETLEVELATILLSPIVNLSNNELAIIKNESSNESFYESVLNYSTYGTNKGVCDKITNFKHFLYNARFELKYKKVYEVLIEIIEKYDLLNYYFSLPNGNENINNINQFLMLLKNEANNFNLNKTINYVLDMLKIDNFKLNLEGGENSVKILTMHKSKGLEYPAVIICNLGKSFNRKVRGNEVVINDELGIGINYKNLSDRVETKTIQKNANILFKLNTELEEQIRLLYVATTRAKSHLSLIGTYNLKNFETNQNKNIYVASNFFDLIFKSVNDNNKNGFKNYIKNFDINTSQSKIANVNIYSSTDIISNLNFVEAKINYEKFDQEVVDSILLNLNKFERKSELKIATKNSVSGVLKEEENYNNASESSFSINIINSIQNENLNMVVGSAYHLIMQNLNYNENIDGINAVISKLILSGKIDKSIETHIDSEKILKAINKVSSLITKNTKILKEQQFLLKIPYNKIRPKSKNETSILIQGVVDLILLNNNNAIIIDFKTNKTNNLNLLIDTYKMQLDCYAEAVINGLKVAVSDKYLYLFNSNILVKVI